ncbi:hypothetical protein HMI56_000180 [Coelomomyces lativittatus]|nr:hypothetical protein HMI56_000180 [Coelomomyces lativittatus]
MMQILLSRISRRKILRQSFHSEPTDRVIQIQLKFPDGTRAKRSFQLSDSVLQLYQYVDTLDPNNEDMLDTPDLQVRVEKMLGMMEEEVLSEIEKIFGFNLISMYPRKTLDDLEITLEAALGKHGASVAVETI